MATLTMRMPGLRTDGPNSLEGRARSSCTRVDLVGDVDARRTNNRVLCGVDRTGAFVLQLHDSRIAMGFLADSKILITGVLSNRSIAYGVARACAARRRDARVHLRQRRT